MRPCPYCGHEVLKSERYCPNCGRIRKAPISLDKYSLGMIENFKQCFVYKYADFEGRASRSEYWNFFLMYQLLFVAILFTCAFLSYISPLSSAVGVGFGLVILVLMSVVMVIPGVAVAVRRLHDQGRSGGLVFIGVVPVIGTIILLVLMALPGESHDNRFGSPTGHVILTKQMAHEIGLIDATPTTGLKYAADNKSEALYLVQESIKGLDAYVKGEVKDFSEVGIKPIDDQTVQTRRENQAP